MATKRKNMSWTRSGNLQFDETGKPYYDTMYMDGSPRDERLYMSPAALNPEHPDEWGKPKGGGLLHSGAEWNTETGEWDTPFAWDKLMAYATAAGIAGPAIAGAAGVGGGGGAAGAAGAGGAGGAAATTIPTMSLAGGVAGGAGALTPAAAFGGAGLASTAIPAASLAGGVGGGAGAVTPAAAFGTGAPLASSAVPGAGLIGTTPGAGAVSGVGGAGGTAAQVANTAAKTGKMAKVGQAFGKTGLDPTMLTLGLLSMLGGDGGPKSYDGTSADPVKTLTEALGASKAMMAQMGSRGPARLRSSVNAPPPAPVSLPGIPFQIGGGLGRDPAIDDPSLLVGREPLNPLGALGNTDAATPKAQATTSPVTRRRPQ